MYRVFWEKNADIAHTHTHKLVLQVLCCSYS